MDFLIREKRGFTTAQTIGAIVLFLLVLFGLLLFFYPGILDSLGVFDFYSGGVKNIDFIESECKLACLDMNETLFCEKERTLKFGGGNSVKGSCGSISDVTVEGYDGIPKCAFITCDEIEEAVCYEEGKKVSCDKLG